MTNKRLQDALISILIGAITAFLTVFLEGALDLLKGLDNNILGGLTSTITYLLKWKSHLSV